MQNSTFKPVTAIGDASPQPSALLRMLNPGPDFDMIIAGDKKRAALQEYIAAKFARDHQAQVQEFLPYLLAMSCAGSFSASVGIRPAGSARLFVETYLDQPVEHHVSHIAGHDIERSRIVEIGNLVATRAGASQLAFIMLAAVLSHAGFEWVACTATEQVQHLLKKLDFTCHTVCSADKNRLGEKAALWGRYYETSPQVIIINVDQALQKTAGNRLANAALAIYQNRVPVLAAELTGNHYKIEA